jgi:hypothetical protein
VNDADVTAPALSVVVVTDRFQTIATLVENLLAQTARDAVELVIVAPAGEGVPQSASRLERFAGVRVVEVESVVPMSAARARGVRATTAPVVFLGETHSFPRPDFASALIEAHRGRWAVVVPGVGNANPKSPLSWAAFLSDYGPWSVAMPERDIAMGPTWNASYKRDVLAAVDEQLETALSSGDELPAALRARGDRAHFSPSARVDHLNVAAFGPWVDERFLAGLTIGANRRRRWPFWRCLVYAAASPLIPVVLCARGMGPYRRFRRRQTLPAGTFVAFVSGLLVRTVGEAAGYLIGLPRPSEARMETYELHKARFVASG